MRLACLLISLLSVSPLAAASLAEKQDPHPVELEQVLAQPQAYQGMRIQFDATFVQTASIFDSFHTGFTAERYLNFVVWDDQGRLWEPLVRADPVMTLYYEKTREGAQQLSTLAKYSLVRVTGEVVSSFRGKPWINCHSVVPYKGVGAFNDAAIYHLQQAVSLDEEGLIDLSDEHYESALAEDLPLATRAAVRELQANTLVDDGRFTKAAAVLAEALDLLKTYPTIDRDLMPSMHYLLAKSLSELAGQHVTTLEQAGSGPDATSAAMFAEAVDHARSAVRLDPAMGGAYAVLGISLAGLEQFELAKRNCQRAIRLLPENAEVRWYLGRIYDMQGLYDQAIATLKDAIDLEPKDYRLHKAIAASYFNRAQLGGTSAQADIASAMIEYDISIRIVPNDPDLHHYAGVVIEYATAQGLPLSVMPRRVEATYDMAIQRFHDALSHDENYLESHVHLAYRYQYAEDHDQSLAFFRSAISLAPARSDLHRELGAYLWRLERRSEAYQAFVALHQLLPSDIPTRYALGRLSVETGDFAQAVPWLDQTIALMPDHPMAHADLVQSLTQTDVYDRALEHAPRALELLAQDDVTNQRRVATYAGISAAALDRQALVITYLTDVVDGATDVRVPMSLGWALTSQQEPEALARSVSLAQAALALDPDSLGAAELLGWALYLTADYPAAEQQLQVAYYQTEENDEGVMTTGMRPGVSAAVAGYRLGMTLFQLGPDHYDRAEPLLQQGRQIDYRSSSLLQSARAEVTAALATIRDYRRAQEQAAREAAAAARAEARAAAKQIASAEAPPAEAPPADDQPAPSAE